MDEPKNQEEKNILPTAESKDSLPSNFDQKTSEEKISEDKIGPHSNNTQNFEIEIEQDNNKKKKYLSINKRNSYNYSKSPAHTNNHIKNKMYNMGKISKPFLTSKHIFLNKYSLKEVNECIYKDYNQIANILPYYQNYYYENKINNYKNNNYSSANNNDSILICLKYIEYSNFFFNSDISYKIQNLLFNIITGDKRILSQNKYSFLKNKLNEVYNKLIPYQIRYNYLKAFYDRNSEESLYYLFKRDLDKINNLKPINYKKLNYLKEIYEIVKQKMGTKKEYINSYINKLLSNKNGGNYNNNLSVQNDSYNGRKQSYNQYVPNNNNIISNFNYHNNNIFINNEEMNLYNSNTNTNKEHNYKGSYPTKHNSNNYFYKNRNNSYFKQELIEIDEPKIKLNDEEENNINNNNEYINLMPHNKINSANNGKTLWNNNININSINVNPFQGFNGNLIPQNNTINNLKMNNNNNMNQMQLNMNNININGNILKNNLFIQNSNNINNNSNKNIQRNMKINLPVNNPQNNIKEIHNENININNINAQDEINNNENNEINNVDFLYNSDDNKIKRKLNSDITLPKINFNDININNDTNMIDNNNINNKNISKNDIDLNIVFKQMISAQILFVSNINKYISQYSNFNQNLDLYKSYLIGLYNQGIINNISFLSQNSYHSTKNNNYNQNMNKINISKQEKIIETDYEKLRQLKNENPEKISENLKLFENYIILPIYNQINYNNNTPETVKLYSNVYSKYKEVINYVIKENNLDGTIVEPYGSIVNNFLTSDGDIDISIVPNNISKIGFKVYLEQIEKELIKRNLIEDNNEINEINNINNNGRIYISTRYTLLTVTDLETNINIDITVHNLLPIKNTEMIRLYSLFDQRFHILGIFLKHWVKINHIKGSRNEFLSSYALLLLIIHFLQDIVEPRVLPFLQEIISEDKNKNDYDYKYCYDDKEFSTNLYYEKNFDNMRQYMKIINCGKENDLSVSELLVQFFEYYGYIYNNINFNNKHYLISIKHSDKNFVANNTEHIAFPLEDPFDVNHNPSSSLKLNTPQYSDFIFCMRKEINNILSGEYFK